MSDCQRLLISAMIFVGENMTKNHDQIVSIAIKSSELLECVQWDQPIDSEKIVALADEMIRQLGELKKEMSSK